MIFTGHPPNSNILRTRITELFLIQNLQIKFFFWKLVFKISVSVLEFLKQELVVQITVNQTNKKQKKTSQIKPRQKDI